MENEVNIERKNTFTARLYLVKKKGERDYLKHYGGPLLHITFFSDEPEECGERQRHVLATSEDYLLQLHGPDALFKEIYIQEISSLLLKVKSILLEKYSNQKPF